VSVFGSTDKMVLIQIPLPLHENYWAERDSNCFRIFPDLAQPMMADSVHLLSFSPFPMLRSV